MLYIFNALHCMLFLMVDLGLGRLYFELILQLILDAYIIFYILQYYDFFHIETYCKYTVYMQTIIHCPLIRKYFSKANYKFHFVIYVKL